MKQLEESGNVLVTVLLVVLLVAALGFGLWAYQSRQDYKNNSDQKVAAAVATARQQESTAKDKQFAEQEKQPLKTYKGPEAYGSVVIKYPKTWSGYVDDTGHSSAVVDGYFAPGVVPAVNNQDATFALRVQVVNQSYSQVVNGFSGAQKQGQVSAKPYSAPRVPSVVGLRLHGQLKNNKTGDMVILPLRDKTLELWTESPEFENDFSKNILANFTFSP